MGIVWTEGVHGALLWVSINKNNIRFQLAGFDMSYGAYNQYLFMRVISVNWCGPWKTLHFNPVSIFSYWFFLGVQDSIESFEVAAGETKSIYYSGGFMLMADSYWGFYRIYALKYQGGFDLLHQNNSEMSIKVEHTGWHWITVKNEPSLYNKPIHVWLIIVWCSIPGRTLTGLYGEKWLP